MNRFILSTPTRNLLFIGCTISFSFILTSCSTALRIESNFVPAGSLRLAQVMAFAKRIEVVQSKVTYDAIIASGIADSEIVDGSVVVARIYCCGGMTENFSSEKGNAIVLYVPKVLNVALGDIVEIRDGRPPEKGDAGLLNIVMRVVQRYEAGKGAAKGDCWWDPKDDRLWLRVLYCDWMPREGWVKQEGLHPAWYKPQSSDLRSK